MSVVLSGYAGESTCGGHTGRYDGGEGMGVRESASASAGVCVCVW